MADVKTGNAMWTMSISVANYCLMCQNMKWSLLELPGAGF